MLPSDADDYRRSSERDLLAGLAARDGLALAEAFHRTVPAVHAVARRLLTSSVEVEALLRAVYGELWRDPPSAGPLEGSLRARAFALGAAHLRERGAPPASPSANDLLPDLPRSEPGYLDAAEQALADLDADDRAVLLRAHDAGEATGSQGPQAVEALERALLALADAQDGSGAASEVGGPGHLGDYVLGLLPAADADTVTLELADHPEAAARVQVLRRGRRRLEGLPPSPDMGQRVLVAALTAGAAPGPRAPASSVLDDLDLDDEASEAELTAPAGGTARLAVDEDDEVAEDAAVPSGAAAVAPDAADVDLFEEPEPPSPPSATATSGAAVADADERTGPAPQLAPDAPEDDSDGAEPTPADDPRASSHALDHEPPQTAGPSLDEERSGDVTAQTDPDAVGDADAHGRSRGGRLLRLLGYVLLLVLGGVVGLLVGQLLVTIL